MANANFKNRTLYHGDNLEFLRGLNSKSVDLVVADPPFQKGYDFHASADSLAAGAKFQDRWDWDEDVHTEWTDLIQDDYPGVYEVIDAARNSYGDDMGAFLCFMSVRLIELHRVLTDTGSIYLHCDDTASHYLKLIMDSIFGRENYKNEIIWKRTAGRSDGKRFGRVHDVILYYTKSKKFTWHTPYMPHRKEYVEKAYRNDDRDGRGRWQLDQLTANGHGQSGGEYFAPWRGVSLRAGRMWNVPMKGGMADWIEANVIPGWKSLAGTSVHARLDLLDKHGIIAWPKKRGGMPRLKRYYTSTKGVAVEDVISDIKKLESNSAEKTGYPTQKPVALYERLINASSNEGDVVLDPFCGCATTCVAAEKLNRQWIGMDLWDKAHEVVLMRLNKEAFIGDGEKFNLFGDVHYSQEAPVRTDEVESTVPDLAPIYKRNPQAWEKLSRQAMFDMLAEAQGRGNEVVCAGCGISLDSRYFHLDHITPRADRGRNTIDNRILLCGPCNSVKSSTLTLSGLVRRNKKEGWIKDAEALDWAQEQAHREAERVRFEMV